MKEEERWGLLGESVLDLDVKGWAGTLLRKRKKLHFRHQKQCEHTHKGIKARACKEKARVRMKRGSQDNTKH